MASIQQTDAYILMQFRDAVKPLQGKPLTHELKLEVGKVALPYFNRLVARGNSRIDSARLLQDVYEDKQTA